MNIFLLSTHRQRLAVIGALLMAGAAWAGPAATGASADAQARYLQELAFCDSGKSSQDLSTCKLEARHALAEAKRGGLGVTPDDQYPRNALARCGAFQGRDLDACEARILHPTRMEGSVGGGGVLRESVVVVPAE